MALMPALLRERILVLDGAMGTMVQRYRFSEEDFRGERFADHPKDVRGNTDLLSLTQARRDPRDPRGLPGSRRGHHQHQHLHGDPHRPGGLRPVPYRRRAQRGRRAAGAGGRRRRRGGRRTTPLRRRLPRPDEPHRLDLAGRERPGGPQRQLRGAGRGVSRGGRGPGARRRRPAPRRDDLRHAQRQGRDLRHRGGVRGPRAADPGRHQRHDRGRVGPHAVRADPRGLLDEHPARAPDARRAQLRPRREAAPRARRGDEPPRRRAAGRLPERRPAQRARRLRRDARRDVDRARRVGARGPDQPRGLVLREHARAHRGHRRRRRGRPAARRPQGHPLHATRRPRAARDPDARRRLRQHRRADQRHRLAQVRPADDRDERPVGQRRAGQGRGRGGRRRARPGRRTAP